MPTFTFLAPDYSYCDWSKSFSNRKENNAAHTLPILPILQGTLRGEVQHSSQRTLRDVLVWRWRDFGEEVALRDARRVISSKEVQYRAKILIFRKVRLVGGEKKTNKFHD